MKRFFIHLFGVLALVSMACNLGINLPASKTAETRTYTFEEAVPASIPAALNLNMVGGNLTLSGGGSAFVRGTIEYNVPEWEPRLEWNDNALSISQDLKTVPFPDGDQGLLNRWDLQLGSTPIALAVNAGAYNGRLNLTGVPITELSIASGAGSTEVRFDAPNPQEMSHFEYRAATSNETVLGLGHANFNTFNFRGGAGSYTLDFSGALQRDAAATLSGAVGNLTVRVPASTQARVNVTGGLREIEATGNWAAVDGTYTNTGAGPLLTIDIQMSIGKLELVTE
jgi:hypothetical protein